MAPAASPGLLLRDGEIPGSGRCDLLIRDGRVEEIGTIPRAGRIERELDLEGGCVLPGLHDHHLHLLASAARRARISCRGRGPVGREWLARRLRAGETKLGPRDWIHGVDLDSRLGAAVDREWLDETFGERPVRIDDSSGHAAVMNTPALDRVAALNASTAGAPEVLARAYGDGWLYNGHRRLRLPSSRSRPPDLAPLGEELARAGVTGVCDATPGLSASACRALGDAVRDGHLPQRLQVLGGPPAPPGALSGPAKLVLADYDLPSYSDLVAELAAHHAAGRPVAVHSVTAASLYLLLAALEEVSSIPGDRIEHASVTPPDTLPRIARLGLGVVTQPHFIRERGDRYLAEVDPTEHSSLYRLRSFARHGIPLAAGSDAPVGSLDPWAAMRAAVSRETRDGTSLGPGERLTPAEAVSLYLGDLHRPGIPRPVRRGMDADLCLLQVPWHEAQRALDRSIVRATLVRGRFIYEAG